jgi:hypothetical protein
MPDKSAILFFKNDFLFHDNNVMPDKSAILFFKNAYVNLSTLQFLNCTRLNFLLFLKKVFVMVAF